MGKKQTVIGILKDIQRNADLGGQNNKQPQMKQQELTLWLSMMR